LELQTQGNNIILSCSRTPIERAGITPVYGLPQRERGIDTPKLLTSGRCDTYRDAQKQAAQETKRADSNDWTVRV